MRNKDLPGSIGAATSLVILLAAGCGIGEPSTTIDEEEAQKKVDNYLSEAFSVLPPSAEPEVKIDFRSATCGEPSSDPVGRVTVSKSYWARELPVEDNKKNAELLLDHWLENNYEIMHDSRPDEISIKVENKGDSFRMAVSEYPDGDLAVTAISNCIWKNGTP
ncbi:hypothetical protein [Nocardiopsis rhodophaea]|uniref:hypothetical protein n=1 Tax=Nocardiopsis rhodophaea TaxID=280238 RepID=UPI0031DCE5D7